MDILTPHSESSPASIAATDIKWIDPRELLHPERLDIAVKAMYANSILGKPTHNSLISAEENYLNHILFRTGGREPGDENRKGSLDQFQQQFIELIDSMQTNGFDANHPIPVARRTGIILNGAHRLAAALCLGIKNVPIILQDDVDGLTWNCNWFVMNGFSPTAIDEITKTWVSLRADLAGCVILWPAAESHWHKIESDIQETTPIVYRRTIHLSTAAFKECVRDIYATDWGPIPGENIERKIDFFSDHKPCIRFLVVSQIYPDDLKKLKVNIRNKYHHIVPADKFATLHTTDTQRETSYIAQLILNRASLAAIKNRPKNGFRPAFLKWLSDYVAELHKLQIDPDKCCVVGSGVLEAYGIRQATDLDFTITHDIRNQFFTPGVTHLTPELDVVSMDYPRAKSASELPPNDNDLIQDSANHIFVRGLKFSNLDIVITRKKHQRRFKDLMDIGLVSKRDFG